MKYKSLLFKTALIILLLQLAVGTIVGLLILVTFFLRFPPTLFLSNMPIVIPFFCALASVILSLLVVPLVVKHILKPLKNLNDAMQKVENGDFTARVAVPAGEGDYSALYRNFNRMAEELEGTELFRKDFINNFSHEFKTPIVSIRGFAKQLQLDDSLTEEQKKEYIEFIVSESDRLSGLSNNILLLTKLENQQYVTERSEFYIDEQIRHALLLFEKQWSEKDLELQLDMEEIFYETDEGMLLQVWINLLSNAVKFSPCGGRLSVSLKKQKEQIVAEISDEGPGIPKEEWERIFDKFYQSDRSHTTEGNGLGLALVKQIATLLGAELSFESEEGKGTVFRFSLPEKMSDLAELVDPQSGAVIKNS
jgi:signal transduction histidine kinase